MDDTECMVSAKRGEPEVHGKLELRQPGPTAKATKHVDGKFWGRSVQRCDMRTGTQTQHVHA